ncbi:hypothetical protein [Maribellus sp. YY47]|uniref:hypothetical protein n=1 Tax=Maribellus sp. YY47 TaxID=2929486 RepID=UPI0020009A87|nr:hypothetical protein [Maribellus sp. YY47]MCK3684374.1 hypothetical protein [Maribellus sp. YY47]
MENEQYKPSEIYAETLEMMEHNEFSLDEQQIVLRELQHLEDVIRMIDNSSQEVRQYNYNNYLVGLSEGTIPFDIMASSFLIYQYRKFGINTRLLELHTDINASKIEEYDYIDVPVSDIRFYENELKKVMEKQLRFVN